MSSASVAEWLLHPSKTQVTLSPAAGTDCPRLVKRLSVCCHVYVIGAHKRTCVDRQNMPNHNTFIIQSIQM